MQRLRVPTSPPQAEDRSLLHVRVLDELPLEGPGTPVTTSSAVPPAGLGIVLDSPGPHR